jgi:hypothetical protein
MFRRRRGRQNADVCDELADSVDEHKSDTTDANARVRLDDMKSRKLDLRPPAGTKRAEALGAENGFVVAVAWFQNQAYE